MSDCDMPSLDPREELASLLELHCKCPNLAVVVRHAHDVVTTAEPMKYIETLKEHSAFLNAIEYNFAALVEERNEMKNSRDALVTERDALKQVAALSAQLQEKDNTGGFRKTRKTRLSENPSKKFDAEDGAPHKVQLAYETWESKIIGVLDRDMDYFDTPKLRIGYISDQCEGKAFTLINGHVNAFRKDPTDPKLPFHDWDTLLQFMNRHYVTMDSSQWSKDRLDTFFQKERSYWPWKAELDELFVKAKKTPEQKVDLLRNRVNNAIKDMFVTLDNPPADDDYEGWSKKADRFARNLLHRDHLSKLEKNATPSTNGGGPSRAQAPQTPADAGDPMDLSAAQYGSASRLPDHEIQRRRNQGLCLACGDPGHIKSAHHYDPVSNPNPLPMPARIGQTNSFPRGGGRGRGGAPAFPGRGGVPAPAFPGRGWGNQQRPQTTYRPQSTYPPMPYYSNQYPSQYQLRAADYDPGHVIGEVPSHYAPTEPDNSSQATHDTSHVLTPVSMQSKDTPLR